MNVSGFHLRQSNLWLGLPQRSQVGSQVVSVIRHSPMFWKSLREPHMASSLRKTRQGFGQAGLAGLDTTITALVC